MKFYAMIMIALSFAGYSILNAGIQEIEKQANKQIEIIKQIKGGNK